ncbi:holin family protein [Pararhodobacter sp. SW119]|uniref:holin family protein n=1 Tax=Pararhodobacter sp. SW119 TaxID=2780075 RepID=UPI001AE0409D|nr:holin family protein [Pararhodobacter sp. SW119]
MGLMGAGLRTLFGGGAAGAVALGQTVGSVAEVFRANATRQMELGHDAYMSAHASHTAEFTHARQGWFDGFVNGLNRLPRPLLALGTLGLFVYAMADPEGFARRMRGLAEVPEPLWWLLGAVVAFYFGAREAHHLRSHKPVIVPSPSAAPEAAPTTANPALDDWRRPANDSGRDHHGP